MLIQKETPILVSKWSAGGTDGIGSLLLATLYTSGEKCQVGRVMGGSDGSVIGGRHKL